MAGFIVLILIMSALEGGALNPSPASIGATIAAALLMIGELKHKGVL